MTQKGYIKVMCRFNTKSEVSEGEGVTHGASRVRAGVERGRISDTTGGWSPGYMIAGKNEFIGYSL